MFVSYCIVGRSAVHYRLPLDWLRCCYHIALLVGQLSTSLYHCVECLVGIPLYCWYVSCLPPYSISLTSLLVSHCIVGMSAVYYFITSHWLRCCYPTALLVCQLSASLYHRIECVVGISLHCWYVSCLLLYSIALSRCWYAIALLVCQLSSTTLFHCIDFLVGTSLHCW